jgi:hypothetical protein
LRASSKRSRSLIRGILFGGKIDANWKEQPGPYLIVLDHKTTGSIGFRKDTKEKLLGHPQAPIYSTWGFRHGDDGQPMPGDTLELRWNYVDTKPKRPMAYPSWHRISADESFTAMDRVVMPTAERLVARVEQANTERRRGNPFAARHLPMNTNACGAFGGCQFRSRCSLTPSQEFNAHMTQATNSFLARLNINPGGASPSRRHRPDCPHSRSHSTFRQQWPGVRGLRRLPSTRPSPTWCPCLLKCSNLP